ncbi:MAG: RNA-binding S4 domain-containing protein [Candidatus Marinimicrobia bacterium]|jgi:ribosome-associated heat shock protein Hsp15|nr:RNA-binding S4 domain-containing protein [Candidatus Neomarinimicrobiota bacterium]MBT3634064.1 RNA-binding S4 domain-containing protein [Candidatus Neomarinimicrobiota bacterium]MBT3683062.1 RNA-binding S4 domain-containing protein [Candidatus Neomarinimicrobiota bacterium]MBT3759846.1 RNA-binding S4 domain-containing protein [Candidatus Neomarinimicrobiota bacterium]MBT3895701.1 RNA-binding S4 domain-containing protein [Candidatus Neomarinimicrobiota bacterium]
MKKTIEKVRIDKWLHAIRAYKTRSLSSDACNSGKVKINDNRIKPSKYLVGGEIITIQKQAIKLVYKVSGLIDKRISAKLVENYREDMTPEDEYLIQKAAIQYPVARRKRGEGRPTKKNRRNIDKIKWST